MTNFQHSFTGSINTMSLWEIAHRWTGHHPQKTNSLRLPTQVKDVLYTLAMAQSSHELTSSRPDGNYARIESTYRFWQSFIPENYNDRSLTTSERHDLFRQHIRAEAYKHIANMRRCAGLLSRLGFVEVDNTYYKKMHIARYDLAYWSLDNSYPFPDFWFSPGEKQELLDDFELEPLIQEKVDALEAESVSVDNSKIGHIREDLMSDAGLDIDEANRKRRKAEKEVDQIWQSLVPSQKDRLICQRIAEVLWEENPHFKRDDIIENPILRKFGLTNKSAGSRTIDNWIRKIDKRPESERRGRPKKENHSLQK